MDMFASKAPEEPRERRCIKIVAGSVVLYWAVFWLMNGLDKFLYGRSILAIRWHGKDRTDQFNTYLENIGFDPSLIKPLLTFAGIWEIILGLAFLLVLHRLFFRFSSSSVFRAISYSTAASVLTFVGFSAFDVVVGDRAELLEHGTYTVLLLVSWTVACMSTLIPSSAKL